MLTHDHDVRIALETMAGKGTEIGRSFEELARIIDGVTHNDRLSICFDTCHTHDAGYNIKNDFDGVLNEFDKIIGIDRIKVVHVNDSKNALEIGICIMNPIMIVPMISNARTPIINVVTKSIRKLIFP